MPGACGFLKELSRSRITGNGSSYYGKPRTSLSTAKKNGVDVLEPNAKLLRLKWKKLERLAHKVGGARNIFMELLGKSRGHDTFWLDTSSGDKVGTLFLLKLCTRTNDLILKNVSCNYIVPG